MRGIEEELRDLERSREPPRDLWPGIRAAALRRLRIRWSGIVLVLVAGLGAGAYLLARELGPRAQERRAVAEVLARFDEVATQYTRSRNELEALLRKLEPYVGAESVAKVKSELDVIDSGIERSRAALASDPRSTELVLSLAESYARRSSLLDDAARFIARYAPPEGG